MTHPTEEKRLFEHDHSCCTFLGTYHFHDLYYCQQGGHIPTLLARYGNEGAEYKSGMEGARFDPELGEAKRRAEERGLPCG